MKPTQEFWEKATLLLVTALLTGLLIPFVLKSIDESRAAEQRRNDADLSRQAKLIDAQSKYLEELADTLWRWRYLSMKVVYSREPHQAAEHESAVREYKAGIWDNLNRFRNLSSKARWLVSERSHGELHKLYERVVAFDARLDLVVSNGLPGAARANALQPLYKELREEMTGELDRVIDMVARDTRLSALVATSPPAAK